MNNVKLIFESPNFLNNLTQATEAQPKQWTTIEGEELELDTENLNISSTTYTELITKWWVNETDYQMTTEPNTPGFEPLTHTFAISMIGQLFPNQLAKFLLSINQLYSATEDNSNDNPNPEPQDNHDDGNEKDHQHSDEP